MRSERKQIEADLIHAAETDLDLCSVTDECWRECSPVASASPVNVSASGVLLDPEIAITPTHIGPCCEQILHNIDPGSVDQPGRKLDVLHDEVSTAVVRDMLILESLEHAQARNAEILAEMVVDRISGGAYLVLPEKQCAVPSREVDTTSHEMRQDPDKAKGNRSSLRFAAVGSAFVVVFFASMFGSIISNQDAVVTSSVPAVSGVAIESSLQLGSANKTWVEPMPSPSGIVEHLARLPARITTVTVQPNDDLRQICLHHLGRYDAEVLQQLRELNPEVSDPDRINVGQKIILSTSSATKTNASKSFMVPKQ